MLLKADALKGKAEKIRAIIKTAFAALLHVVRRMEISFMVGSVVTANAHEERDERDVILNGLHSM